MSAELEPIQAAAPASITPILANVVTEQETITLIMDPNACLALVEAGLTKMTQPGKHENPGAKQLAGLMKIAVKGVLLMYGNKILETMLGKDHPKPGKQDDLVEWWTHMLARFGIGLAMKHMAILEGKRDGDTIQIAAIHTQPNPNLPANGE